MFVFYFMALFIKLKMRTSYAWAVWLNASGKERSGMYMNPLWIFYPTRKLISLKQRKREISGELTL